MDYLQDLSESLVSVRTFILYGLNVNVLQIILDMGNSDDDRSHCPTSRLYGKVLDYGAF